MLRDVLDLQIIKFLENMKYCIIFMLMFTNTYSQKNNMIIRIAELEIETDFIENYKSILKEEANASVKLEKGVISIFPMYQKENPAKVRILEIYANKEAYESHLKTPHFLKYKTSTGKMVKSLQLIDMESLDPETMNQIFRKL